MPSVAIKHRPQLARWDAHSKPSLTRRPLIQATASPRIKILAFSTNHTNRDFITAIKILPNSQLHQVLFILDLVQRAQTLTRLLPSNDANHHIIAVAQTLQTKPKGCASWTIWTQTMFFTYRIWLLMQNIHQHA